MKAGTLWQAARERTARALASGALEPIPTRGEIVADAGIPFVVRVVESPAWKPAAPARSTGASPFLPHDPALFVADVSDTHLCLLNKYTVVSHHLLLVTRAFAEQESALDRADFEALWTCMAEGDALAFYNAGARAGASQRHKHLQLVPLPLVAPSGAGDAPAPRVPIEVALARAHGDGRTGAAPLPFAHALARVELGERWDPREVAAATQALYAELCRELALDAAAEPYNLLVTREWMLLVPRTAESFASIAVNALGFAGALLARGEAQAARIRTERPLRILREVARPREP